VRARAFAVVIAALLVAAAPAGSATAAVSRFSIGYSSEPALEAAVARAHGTVVRRLPALHIAEVQPQGPPLRFAARIACLPGIRTVEPVAARVVRAEPALAARLANGLPLEWAYEATQSDAVPVSILVAASAFTIAVVDTGADLTAPDLAAKTPTGFNIRNGSTDVRDGNGHGTFVASLAAGAVANLEGIAGFGGAARLLIVKAGGADGTFSDVDEAAGIVYAVDRGARIINLSFGGPATSTTEQTAVAYAASHGVLLVAAAGNEARNGNPVQYPAALLQPVGSNGVGGIGLAVGASTMLGRPAPFSSFGSYLSLLAPGVNLVGALPSAGTGSMLQPITLPRSRRGRYGLASGSSFAAPQVSGAAALVWAANPSLSAEDVATILKETATGDGAWTPTTGYGVLDVAAAVARASGMPLVALHGLRTPGGIRLVWRGHGVSTFRLAVSEDGGESRVLADETSTTSAFFPLADGHAYSFTVTGLGADGAPAVTSAPYRVATVRSDAAVALAASRMRTGATRLLMLTASLRAARASVPLASRLLLLEAWNGKRWGVIGRAHTDLTGQAQWTVRVERRSYRIRVLFRGSDDLAAASSAALAR
jgi:subtilisin family serine protease